MAVWWLPDEHAQRRKAVIYLPKKQATAETLRRTMTHCAQRNYAILAVTHGRDGRTAARRLLSRRAVDVVVTIPCRMATLPGTEVAHSSGEETALTFGRPAKAA